jgi:hypothetical protein
MSVLAKTPPPAAIGFERTYLCLLGDDQLDIVMRRIPVHPKNIGVGDCPHQSKHFQNHMSKGLSLSITVFEMPVKPKVDAWGCSTYNSLQNDGRSRVPEGVKHEGSRSNG